MNRIRQLLRRNAAFALALMMLALMARTAIPAGYMPATVNGHIEIVLCSGHGPAAMAMAAPMPMAQGHGGDHAPAGHDRPCDFAPLSLAALDAAPPALAAPSATVVAATSSPVPRRVSTAAIKRLRPPLRAPPLFQA